MIHALRCCSLSQTQNDNKLYNKSIERDLDGLKTNLNSTIVQKLLRIDKAVGQLGSESQGIMGTQSW